VAWLAAFDARGMGADAGRSDGGGAQAGGVSADGASAVAGDAGARGHTAAGDAVAGESAASESAAGESAAGKAAASDAAPGATTATRLDAPALRALLARDAAWIGAERQALQALDQAVATATGGLEQTRAQREAHERARPAPLPADDGAAEDSPAAIQSALAELGTTLATLRERLGGLELALRRDDEIRHKAAELLHAIEAQEQAARIWWQMNELIGAADGKKFRNYAQQLTLDILLGYANAHLKDLARRYRLERVPSSLALMVIDQDMGDEQRSVHSLSGGESFLVSLALALGLASLSSHRVRVESLFIDEGFGSLDADTLRVAMDALDSLQAMGRKVGVISHVEEMTERIATRIHVRRLPGGQSRVEVSGAP
jgi:exonuclease SbcC